MRGGFAHVVDDETRWNKNFGRDVLCGLLGLPENVSGAKKRALPPAVLKREMDAFLDTWEPVDWTKQLLYESVTTVVSLLVFYYLVVSHTA